MKAQKRSVVHHGKTAIWHEMQKHKAVYLSISPFFILFFIFGIYPIFWSLVLSFQSWDGLGDPKFVGFRNFRFLVQDSDFWTSVYNTFVILLESTIPQLFLALLVAILLNTAFVKFKSFFRTVFFMPNVTSIVVVTIIFGSLYGTDYGLLNSLLSMSGHETHIDWLNTPALIQIAISTMVIWRWTGYYAIIFLAGLQSIPHEIYEAARIDGASRWQSFSRITVPMLKPVILFTVMISTIQGLQIFTEPQILTRGTGGADQAGLTVVLYLYNQAFKSHSYGYSSAIAWALFLIIVILSALNWKLFRFNDRS